MIYSLSGYAEPWKTPHTFHCRAALENELGLHHGDGKHIVGIGRSQVIFLPTRISASLGKHLGEKMAFYFLKLGFSSPKAVSSKDR